MLNPWCVNEPLGFENLIFLHISWNSFTFSIPCVTIHLTWCKLTNAHNYLESQYVIIRKLLHVSALKSHHHGVHSCIKQSFNSSIISSLQQNCPKFVNVWFIVDGFEHSNWANCGFVCVHCINTSKPTGCQRELLKVAETDLIQLKGR